MRTPVAEAAIWQGLASATPQIFPSSSNICVGTGRILNFSVVVYIADVSAIPKTIFCLRYWCGAPSPCWTPPCRALWSPPPRPRLLLGLTISAAPPRSRRRGRHVRWGLGSTARYLEEDEWEEGDAPTNSPIRNWEAGEECRPGAFLLNFLNLSLKKFK